MHCGRDESLLKRNVHYDAVYYKGREKARNWIRRQSRPGKNPICREVHHIEGPLYRGGTAERRFQKAVLPGE